MLFFSLSLLPGPGWNESTLSGCLLFMEAAYLGLYWRRRERERERKKAKGEEREVSIQKYIRIWGDALFDKVACPCSLSCSHYHSLISLLFLHMMRWMMNDDDDVYDLSFSYMSCIHTVSPWSRWLRPIMSPWAAASERIARGLFTDFIGLIVTTGTWEENKGEREKRKRRQEGASRKNQMTRWAKQITEEWLILASFLMFVLSMCFLCSYLVLHQWTQASLIWGPLWYEDPYPWRDQDYRHLHERKHREEWRQECENHKRGMLKFQHSNLVWMILVLNISWLMLCIFVIMSLTWSWHGCKISRYTGLGSHGVLWCIPRCVSL